MSGIIPTRAFNPSDLVHTEEPFVQVVSKTSKDEICEYCCKNSEDLTACTGCPEVKYCSKACQEKDWPDHRLVCEHLKNLPEYYKPDVIHLLGKVILKLKGKDWKTVKSYILGREVSFDDINSHLEELTDYPRVALRYKELQENVRMFIGDENMPNEDDLIKIIGKVLYNGFFKSSSKREYSVMSFFIGASLIDHECIPNCNQGLINRTLKIWATKKIEETLKISLSFRDVFASYFDNMMGNGEDCNCTDCSLLYGESILTRITDEKKAFSVISATEQFLFLCQYFPKESMTPDVARKVDALLKQQEGVLASTNSLRLKLLNINCFEIEINPRQRKIYLMELERSMSAVFGEYCLKMLDIYNALIDVSLELETLFEAVIYLRKATDFCERMESQLI